jgi:hypothetical protein
MDLLSDVHENFRSILSNVDTVWVRWMGYHRSAENTIHVIDNDIKNIIFDQGFKSFNAPLLNQKHVMYRTMNNISIPIAENSCYTVFDPDIPIRVRLLKFEDGKFNLYRFDVIQNRFVACDESLREWKLVCNWYKGTRCTPEEVTSRFEHINRRGLRYANSVIQRLPSCMLEDKEILAVNYVTRRTSDNLVRTHHWTKVAIVAPITYQIYKYLYFEEYTTRRRALLERLDPKVLHIRRVPRGVFVNVVFAAWVAANTLSC